MADLLAVNVTTVSAYRNGGTNGRARLTKRVKFNNTTAGTVANKLLASAMGFKVIEQCSGVYYDGATKNVYAATPSPAGDYLLLGDATDATKYQPVDLATGASFAYVSVTGYD